jgi:hypothetical protein
VTYAFGADEWMVMDERDEIPPSPPPSPPRWWVRPDGRILNYRGPTNEPEHHPRVTFGVQVALGVLAWFVPMEIIVVTRAIRSDLDFGLPSRILWELVTLVIVLSVVSIWVRLRFR